MNRALILISGPPGVGKSTLAKALSMRLGALHLDKDAIDEPFSPNDRGDHYTRHVEPKVLSALLNLAELNLANGLSVILDVPWTHILLNSPEWIDRIRECASRCIAPLKVIECTLDPEVLYQRLSERGLERDKPRLTTDGWKRFQKTDRLGETNPLPHLSVDMRADLDEIIPLVTTFVTT